MRPIARFSLRPRDSEGRSELWAEGQAVGLVDGTSLEAQFELEHAGQARYLLLTSYDAPYEELVHAYLVAATGKTIERLKLRGALCSWHPRGCPHRRGRHAEFPFPGTQHSDHRKRTAGPEAAAHVSWSNEMMELARVKSSGIGSAKAVTPKQKGLDLVALA